MPIYVKADKVKSDHTYTQFPITINDNTDSAVPEWGLFGAGSQTGTPTPDNPIQPTFCGVRTSNLVDVANLSNVGWATQYPALLAAINALPNGVYTMSIPFELTARNDTTDSSVCGWHITNGGSVLSSIRISWQTAQIGEIMTVIDTFTIDDSNRGAFDALYLYGCGINGVGRTGYATAKNIMLNLGSTALPYENFGYKIPITLRDFSCTILGVQQSTNYAYISKSVLPNASVGDYISTTIEGVDYSLAIMQIDDNYIYIENRTV